MMDNSKKSMTAQPLLAKRNYKVFHTAHTASSAYRKFPLLGLRIISKTYLFSWMRLEGNPTSYGIFTDATCSYCCSLLISSAH
jgi:hypothetical protein